MANNNNKTIYIIIGIVAFIIAIPILLAILGVIGGFLYYRMGN